MYTIGLPISCRVCQLFTLAPLSHFFVFCTSVCHTILTYAVFDLILLLLHCFRTPSLPPLSFLLHAQSHNRTEKHQVGSTTIVHVSNLLVLAPKKARERWPHSPGWRRISIIHSTLSACSHQFICRIKAKSLVFEVCEKIFEVCEKKHEGLFGGGRGETGRGERGGGVSVCERVY